MMVIRMAWNQEDCDEAINKATPNRFPVSDEGP